MPEHHDTPPVGPAPLLTPRPPVGQALAGTCPPLHAAIEALARAFVQGPLARTDPKHELAFAVARAYLEALLGAPEEASGAAAPQDQP